MTVVNGYTLLGDAPIKDMLTDKMRLNGVSHGLGEAGYDIRLKQTLIFKPSWKGTIVFVDDEPQEGRFVKASAIEEFNMPNTLMGIVHDKSTWAREGISVFNTVIEPGWKGFLTLEIVFHGSSVLTIPAGTGIAQVVFHRLTDRATYDGKYQGQPDKPVDPIYENPS